MNRNAQSIWKRRLAEELSAHVARVRKWNALRNSARSGQTCGTLRKLCSSRRFKIKWKQNTCAIKLSFRDAMHQRDPASRRDGRIKNGNLSVTAFYGARVSRCPARNCDLLPFHRVESFSLTLIDARSFLPESMMGFIADKRRISRNSIAVARRNRDIKLKRTNTLNSDTPLLNLHYKLTSVVSEYFHVYRTEWSILAR